jgi:hypothetical protein
VRAAGPPREQGLKAIDGLRAQSGMNAADERRIHYALPPYGATASAILVSDIKGLGRPA